jgi:REP element-mobilizing transposase RayT
MVNFPSEWPQFYTATILNKRPVLINDSYKDIIIDSLRFLIDNKRIELNGFVIMSNHIHLIWQPISKYSMNAVQSSFMKFTALQIIRKMNKDDLKSLDDFKVNKYDRKYQIWKREPLSIELFTPEVFDQKLEYIHDNPVNAGLCAYPDDYHYSSAKFYFTGTDDFGILTHFNRN